MQTILDLEEVKAYLSAHKDEMIADLFSIVRIPSVWRAASDGTPYGKDCLDCLTACLKLFTDAGFSGKMSEDGRYAVAFYGGENVSESVGLFAHTDVVPAGEDWILTSPFEPKLFDGYAVGRGVKDNKAGVILSLWILKYFKEKGFAPRRPITVFLGSAEEKEMTDIPLFVEAYGSPFVSLVPDSGYSICYGEKGIARFRFVSKSPFQTSLVMEGGTAPNVVLDKVTAVFSDASLAEALTKAAEGEERISVSEDQPFTVRANGIAAHASAPANSINAGYLLTSFLKEIDALPAEDRAILANAATLLATTDGSIADIAGTDGFFTPLTMANGVIRTEEGRLCLTFDIRYTPHIEPDVLEAKMAACAEKYGFESVVISNRPGFRNPIDSPAVTAMLDTAELLSGTRPKPYLMGGGTYARKLQNAYSIGLIVPYIADPFVSPAKGHGGPHEADEHLPIDSFLGSVALAAEVVAKLSSD